MKRLFLLLTFMVSFVQMRADEGMWLMMLIKRLNGVDMQKEGLHLTPEEIYSVNNSSMKDAILQFGGGCTAEIVSPKGLIFTNHHCGYGAIAAASTPEKDYLTNGFWAKNNGEEISSKGLSVRFFVRMDDATKRITSKLNNDMSADQRKAIIDAEIKAIQSENSENGKYTVVVKDFFKGNEFYYFVFQDFKDVRLVGTPPSSIGKYGGDTDNWEWPRHTGDFSVFRVYADKNGNPAEYSADNVPLKPKHYLPISLKGNKPGDFAMIVGYPGTTNRYLTSFGIEQMVSKDYPAWVEASKTAMDVMKKHMDKDDATRLAYASNYASVANYWKNRAGTIEAVYKNGTIGDKKEVEKKYQQWAEKAENKAVYGNVLANTDAYYKQISNRNIEKNYGAQFQRNAKYIRNSFQIGDALTSYMKQDASAQAAMKPKLEAAVKQAYEGFNTQLETEMLSQMASLYQSKVAADVASATVKSVNASELANIAQSSIFANATSVINFLNNPSAEKLANDKLYKFAAGYIGDNKVLAEKYAKTDEGFQKDSRLFMDGLMKAMPEKKFYPDANSTIRLTYGKIETLPKRADRDYTGIKQNYYTTMEGMIKKYKKGDEEFDLPQGLLDLYKKKDYGMYKDKDGQLHVNFLSNNDITGGNSGSPIIDGYGRLIGLAFDGNSEALSGDIVFEPKLQRTINVDVRYVLWVIDKFAGAKNLISELTLVK
ncbi:S46 family peptidase [Elizabethkingia anophelis]|uniref:Dipeptidyl-peptidase n=2 Tax=Elizabethkingia anophelis TaxID=1117645 RepID=A0AAE4T0Z3_9FLAO|nr:S46 family peptidase [Elizabethkingia anophelis]AQW90687.1 peptidase S46 [Elizabethkingia anophelis]KUY25744.1 peptidase S46 [Elizabethkingia anophelis]MCT3728576.1 S46 family peptidase [Elizabethkingia anophelis]MCT4235658.1 S46 family peptidase [Elizabethkingia anophelis]MCT4319802.1 S46 family peptidase [Elizabethkingia anophelis]